MISLLIGYPILLIASILTYWYANTFWIYMLIFNVIMYIWVFAYKRKNENLILNEHDGLSDEAIAMMKKFTHIYAYPFATRDVASLCTINRYFGAVFGLFAIYKGDYWKLGYAVVNWFTLAYAAYFFNPTLWFSRSNQLHIHDEIVNHIFKR